MTAWRTETKRFLIELLKQEGVLTDERLERAFRVIDRCEFVPADLRRKAYENYPLPIGYGQTISQPYTVAFMLELLDVQPGMEILDIGSGSGWTTALLGFLTGPGGMVVGLERIPELVEMGIENLKAFPMPNVTIRRAGEELGIPGRRFDRILVSAATGKIPYSLVSQLGPRGVLVMPVGYDLCAVRRTETGEIQADRHHGFVFVPLIT